jgi:hypothetical protein
MSKVNDGGPAFPGGAVRKTRPAHDPGADFRVTDITEPKQSGMTLRQYAAIKLRVPNSGTDWLDEMIRTSLRDEFAAKAMAALIPESFSQDDEHRPDVIADRSYWFADAMRAAREDS